MGRLRKSSRGVSEEAESGQDTTGKRYRSMSEMWRQELHEVGSDEPGWYDKSRAYWDGVDATVDGMLGGLEHLSPRDVVGSTRFLEGLGDPPLEWGGVALDVGAGIGRVTKLLLGPMFGTVDMLECNARYLEKSKDFLVDEERSSAAIRVERRICEGMENFSPEAGRYSLIWIQWCVIYLTDDDFVEFLRRCCGGLTTEGYICVKDNITWNNSFVLDKDDSSVTRSDSLMKRIFASAGLRVVREQTQTDFPKDLFPVKIYALRPKELNIEG